MTSRSVTHQTIFSAIHYAQSIRTVYGPGGMQQLSSDSVPPEMVSPSKLLIERLQQAQLNAYGDGSVGVALLSAALAERALICLEKYIHPTLLYSVFMEAAQLCEDLILQHSHEINVEEDMESLLKVARAALCKPALGFLDDIVVKAMRAARDAENVHTECIKGGTISDSFFLQGHESLPKLLSNPKVLLLDLELEYKYVKEGTTIETTPDQLLAAVVSEWNVFQRQIDSIISAGPNVILNSHVIGDAATQAFAKVGIAAIGRLGKPGLQRAERAFGGRIIHSTESEVLSRPGIYGTCDKYEERTFGSHRYELFSGCHNGNMVSIVLRAGAQLLLDQAQRAVERALACVSSVMRMPVVVYGGGCTEALLSAHIDAMARKEEGKRRLILSQFAEGLLDLPRALAENAGFTPGPLVAELILQHKQHLATTPDIACTVGLDLDAGNVCNLATLRGAVLEPAHTKIHLIACATETACVFFRVQKILVSKAPSIAKAQEDAAERTKQQRLLQRMARNGPKRPGALQSWQQ